MQICIDIQLYSAMYMCHMCRLYSANMQCTFHRSKYSKYTTLCVRVNYFTQYSVRTSMHAVTTHVYLCDFIVEVRARR